MGLELILGQKSINIANYRFFFFSLSILYYHYSCRNTFKLTNGSFNINSNYILLFFFFPVASFDASLLSRWLFLASPRHTTLLWHRNWNNDNVSLWLHQSIATSKKSREAWNANDNVEQMDRVPSPCPHWILKEALGVCVCMHVCRVSRGVCRSSSFPRCSIGSYLMWYPKLCLAVKMYLGTTLALHVLFLHIEVINPLMEPAAISG